MSEPFVGEIRMFAGNFAPRGWALCDGQLLAVSQNDALFSLFGTIYGGDGRTTFGLPDMRGRIPLHAGTGPGLSPRRLGAKSGDERVTLQISQLPTHTHQLTGNSADATDKKPTDKVLAKVPGGSASLYNKSGNPLIFSSKSVTSFGGSHYHTNLMPAICINYIVALFGIYPSRQ